MTEKVIGRSERNVSDLFAAARAAAPCVLFLDQVLTREHDIRDVVCGPALRQHN